MAFSLPPEISSQKQQQGNSIVYTFRHKTVGELGRLVLSDTPDGQCHIATEVVGAPNDPMTQARREIFLPLSDQLSKALEAGLRASGRITQPTTQTTTTATKPPESPPLPQERVASKLIPCPRCGEAAAMLIFADQARDKGELEDYARKMYSNYKQLDVPTWILGAPKRLPDNDISCPTFRVWPKRGPIREKRPDEFNREVDGVLAKHC